MPERLARISILQTSITVTVLYVILTLIFVVPIGIFVFLFSSGADRIKSLSFLFAPLIYGILGFIFSAIGCAIYNLTAKWTGGIEFALTKTEGSTTSTEN